MRPPIDGANVLITGASSGIGRALALQLAPRARSLVLVARRVDRLEALRDELQAVHPRLDVSIESCDLSDPAVTDTMASGVLERVGTIDILVNNAGVDFVELFERVDWQTLHRMIQVNVVALALLTHRFVGPMIARNRGGVLNIGSGTGHVFMAGVVCYTGTKHFVDGFSESLRLELIDSGVTVTQVCPGPVDTEFHAIVGTARFRRKPPRFLMISAERCAREAIAGFERGRALVFPGVAASFLLHFVSALPRFVQRAMLGPAARTVRASLLAPQPPRQDEPGGGPR